MLLMKMIGLHPHDGVEEGDNCGEDGDGHMFKMLNLGENRRRWSLEQDRRQRYINSTLLLPTKV
jgi:hypothetical protein